MVYEQKYKLDAFSIFTLIVAVLAIVFLIVGAVYYYHMLSMKPPSKGESTFLFWTSIIFIVLLFGLMIWSLIRLFTYKVWIYTPEVKTTVIEKPADVAVQTKTVKKDTGKS